MKYNIEREKRRIFTGHLLDYNIGDIVYLKTDIDNQDRFITSILLQPNGVKYFLEPSGEYYYDFQISKNKKY